MKFQRTLVLASLAVTALTAPFSVGFAAEDLKVATVDMQKAIQTVDAGKKAKTQLENELNKKRQELTAEEGAVKKMVEDFKKQSLVMNDDARAKKQGEIQERMVKLQELHAKSQGDLQKREAELTQPIVNRLKSVISEIAKQKGYKLVLEKNENTVLFSDEKDDLTNDVVAQFNKGAGKS